MTLRTVVEEPRFSQDLDSHRQQFRGVDNMIDEVFFLLAHTPWIGESLEVAPDFRVLRAITDFGQAFWLLYSYDASRVYMHSMEPIRAE